MPRSSRGQGRRRGGRPLPLPPTPPPPAPAAPPTTTPPEVTMEPASPNPLLAVPSGPTVAAGDDGRLYRGTVRTTADGGGLQLMNELDVEEYLQGMGEVIDPNW